MAKSGFYWHVHHDILLEYCYDYDERADYIRTNKPEHEIETRIRLMQPVQGKLPAGLVKAARAYAGAGKARDEAWRAFHEAWDAFHEVRDAYYEAWRTCDEAREAFHEARAAHYEAWDAHRTEIEALHAEECGCSEWNGEELIFEEIE